MSVRLETVHGRRYKVVHAPVLDILDADADTAPKSPVWHVYRARGPMLAPWDYCGHYRTRKAALAAMRQGL